MEPVRASSQEGARLPALGGFRTLLVCLLLAAAVFAAFGGALGNGFAWDDDELIFIDCVTRRPLDWRAIFLKPVDRLYRPLRTLVYIVEFDAWGRNPALFHLTNLSLHAAVVILVFMLALRLSASPPASFAAALLFGVHPVHAGTVGFISGGRSDLLAAALTLLSLIFYMRSSEQKSSKAEYPLSLAFFALALTAKESAAVAPAFIVCLVLLKRNGRVRSREWLRAGAFFALFAVYACFRFGLLDMGGQASGFHGGSLRNTLLTTVTVWGAYVRGLLAPGAPCPIYAVDIQHHLSARVAVMAGFLSVSAAAAFVGLLRKQLWGFGLAWFFIALLPVSNLLPINSLRSDRFLYLPSIGMMIVVADIAARAAGAAFGERGKRAAAVCVIALAAAAGARLAFITRPAVAVWKNDETLWTAATVCASRSWVAWTDYGKVLFDAGRTGEAVLAMKNAAALNPDNPMVYNNLADAHGFRGEYEQSIQYLERALALDPSDPLIRLKMSFALMKTGDREAALRRLEEGRKMCADENCEGKFDKMIAQIKKRKE